MSAVTVRNLALGELIVLSALYGASFEEPYPEPVAASLLRTPGAWCQLAFPADSETPAGFIIARAILDEVEVLSVGTLPECRRGGLGLALMQSTLTIAEQAGARVVHLEVGEDNPGAMALYRKLGFQRTGRRANYYRRANRRRVAAILMSCDLNP